MPLLCQLKLPLFPLWGCAGELGLSQPGRPGLRGAGHSKQVNLRRAVLDRLAVKEQRADWPKRSGVNELGSALRGRRVRQLQVCASFAIPPRAEIRANRLQPFEVALLPLVKSHRLAAQLRHFTKEEERAIQPPGSVHA
ncbi:unnamed protein product [Pleuronectes platessa]|uniref:Secreted protein n=1 Tax=Pleuronectes platessa TaxID=8262 RepID=A0A9N7U841_PLEPL|nr:unnamed protein product [Pleuronectes platessa]